MPAPWDARLLDVALARARSWAGENPITYSIVFGVPAVLIQAAITVGVLQGAGLWAAIASIVVVPILIVGFMLVSALLQMLYEVREALGELLDPTVAAGDPTDFSLELASHGGRDVAVRITNHTAAGEFHAKIVELHGVDPCPVPISVRWRDDRTIRTRRINQGDSEVLSVIRVRGRRAVDFLEPVTNGDAGYRRVTALNGSNSNGANGSTRANGTAPVAGSVGAVLQVFNRRDDAEGHRSHLIEVAFDDSGDVVNAELRPV